MEKGKGGLLDMRVAGGERDARWGGDIVWSDHSRFQGEERMEDGQLEGGVKAQMTLRPAKGSEAREGERGREKWVLRDVTASDWSGPRILPPVISDVVQEHWMREYLPQGMKTGPVFTAVFRCNANDSRHQVVCCVHGRPPVRR